MNGVRPKAARQSQKHGISALGLKRALGIGSEQTAWAMLHRYRTATVRPGRERLSGIVEVDETFLGGPEPGRRGRGALGKTTVEVAVEQDGRALGRCRLQVIASCARAPSLISVLEHAGWRLGRHDVYRAIRAFEGGCARSVF